MKSIAKIVRRQLAVTMTLLALLGLAVVPSAVAYADTKSDICQGVGIADGTTGCAKGTGVTVESAIKTAIKLLSYVAGVASVIMIIVAGLRYITSNGDPSGIKSAKDAIIYAIVGLIVVVISQSIVKFVLNSTASASPKNTYALAAAASS